MTGYPVGVYDSVMTEHDTQSRRTFLKSSAITVGFLGLQACVRQGSMLNATSLLSPGAPSFGPGSKALGYGPLVKDPKGIFSLPEGFSYTIFSRTGDLMDDGYAVPAAHDGMAAFEGPGGTTILVRNHELSAGQATLGAYAKDENAWSRMDQSKVYDASGGKPFCVGGTTTMVFDTKTQTLIKHFQSLAGTIRNCSGGPTPWGSWVTCEETVARANEKLDKDHGYNFDVPARADISLADPVPLTAMGRFNHEAIAVDEKSGIVYETEDRHDGLIYRFIPKVPGQLAKGGRLQALAIKDAPSRDTRNWPNSGQDVMPIGQDFAVEWIDMDDVQSPKDDLRGRGFKAGAARFARGEGMFYGNDEIYFACTNGGAKKFGQVFRYVPSPYEGTARENEKPGTLQIFIESHEIELLKSCDNLTIAPWGDIVLCEDDGGDSGLMGVSPAGRLYPIGHTQRPTEIAGSCFSPDGTTLFVNMQRDPGQTIAITGPWETRVA